MSGRLLLIDPQNDFCDITDAALPVPGAASDLARVAGLMQRAGDHLDDVIVTLDSHAAVGIERVTFWSTGAGEAVQPFTRISAADVRTARFQPRDGSRVPAVLEYLDALERGGRYRLVVWPVHCVVGTWGHNLHEAVGAQITRWEQVHQRPVLRVLKGMNPMTEQYSAIQAEVPIAEDPATQKNRTLIERARPRDGLLLVAGEAASHCVAATLEHLLAEFTPEERRRVRLLRDCMSPVSGFEAQATTCLDAAQAQGARLVTAVEALAEIH
jgi:nicotinamidase/pyrazinamidase